jgi:hypothetical protein
MLPAAYFETPETFLVLSQTALQVLECLFSTLAPEDTTKFNVVEPTSHPVEFGFNPSQLAPEQVAAKTVDMLTEAITPISIKDIFKKIRRKVGLVK